MEYWTWLDETLMISEDKWGCCSGKKKYGSMCVCISACRSVYRYIEQTNWWMMCKKKSYRMTVLCKTAMFVLLLWIISSYIRQCSLYFLLWFGLHQFLKTWLFSYKILRCVNYVYVLCLLVQSRSHIQCIGAYLLKTANVVTKTRLLRMVIVNHMVHIHWGLKTKMG